jgi:hypothetical protein
LSPSSCSTGAGRNTGVELRSRIAIYAENHSEAGDRVLFWAASPGENFMANRPTASASLFYPLYVESEIAARLNEQFLEEVMTAPPLLIVDTNDQQALSLDREERARQIAGGLGWAYLPSNLDDFFLFVEENYYLEAIVADRAVYRLRSAQ